MAAILKYLIQKNSRHVFTPFKTAPQILEFAGESS